VKKEEQIKYLQEKQARFKERSDLSYDVVANYQTILDDLESGELRWDETAATNTFLPGSRWLKP
jgi:hypothetical protein